MLGSSNIGCLNAATNSPEYSCIRACSNCIYRYRLSCLREASNIRSPATLYLADGHGIPTTGTAADLCKKRVSDPSSLQYTNYLSMKDDLYPWTSTHWDRGQGCIWDILRPCVSLTQSGSIPMSGEQDTKGRHRSRSELITLSGPPRDAIARHMVANGYDPRW